MRYLHLTLIALMVFIVSCAFHEEYPKSWRPITELAYKECPDISGKYINEGEDATSNYKPSLSWGLFRDTAPWKEATHLSFMQKDNKQIDITIWNNDKAIFSKTLNYESNSFICKDGLLKINIKEYINRDGVLGSEWNTFGFSRSDNYLIVKNESGAIGLFFLVHVAGSGINWYRFKEAKE